MSILDKIESPSDLKKLSIDELSGLAGEVRQAVLKKVSEAGGHIGPNLGMVEATVALHYVFDSPRDKFVFDVSHQCYPHKILTGRKKAFLDPAAYHDVTGYTNPHESEHDFFTVGHTSTSISLACGLAKARDLRGEKENIIAIIGDGSLSGGEAYEGLNNAVEAGTNMIVLVNDNEMSIGENAGGLYKNLKRLRDTDGTAEDNFFKAVGFEYHYVKNGHDLNELISVFRTVKDSPRPVVVHMHTVKGKGFAPAENDKETYHAGGPFSLETGEFVYNGGENYMSITGGFLREKMKNDPSIAVITAGTPVITGFAPAERKALGKQFIDVGIAEEHAVAMASGMAKNGAKPVFSVFSTFVQRTYDQLSQDLCINNNPALILVYAASLTGFNDVTHLCCFDIPVMSNIPNLVYLAPTCKNEYLAMLEWGVSQREHPVAIRIPGGFGAEELWSSDKTVAPDFSDLNTFEVEEKGSEIAIVALGSFFRRGKELKAALKDKTGIDATLINPRFITGLDETLLRSLEKDHKLVVTLEDGVLDGGFGEKISRFYGSSDMKVVNFGGKKEFTDRLSAQETLERNHLTTELMLADIAAVLTH